MEGNVFPSEHHCAKQKKLHAGSWRRNGLLKRRYSPCLLLNSIAMYARFASVKQEGEASSAATMYLPFSSFEKIKEKTKGAASRGPGSSRRNREKRVKYLVKNPNMAKENAENH